MQKEEDFIKRMKQFNKTFVFLTEQNQLIIQEGESEEIKIHFPSPIYDALMIQDVLMISIRNMPIAIYKLDDNEWKMFMRLHDVKPNSEQFLAPLEMKILQANQNIIGCGKGFLHEYDLAKAKVINYKCIKIFDYVSCLDCSQENQSFNVTKNIVLLGQFNKQIKIIDTMQDKQIGEAKVHIGGITHLQFDKYDSLYFYSCARFDDYVYQWDLRNTSTFVQYYERKNQTNQRMNFDINSKRQLLVGNYDGSCYLYLNQEERKEFTCSNSCVHSAIINEDGQCYVAYGQRSFNEEQHETGVYKFSINQ